MFERYTDRARHVIVWAQEEAKDLNHNYIGTEHILLGLLHESEGVAAKALESLGISLDVVREQVLGIIGQGQQRPTGHIPFIPRAKKVLELSLRESLQLGHTYIGTEHILLALIREGEGIAARVIMELGADLDRARQQVIQLLSDISDKRLHTRVIWSDTDEDQLAIEGLFRDSSSKISGLRFETVDGREIVAATVTYWNPDGSFTTEGVRTRLSPEVRRAVMVSQAVERRRALRQLRKDEQAAE